MTTRKLAVLLASTALSAAYAMPANAQTGDPVADAKLAAQVERPSNSSDDNAEVTVTGTRIVRPNNRSAAPITSTTAAEIAAQGAVTIEEVLNRLPQVQPNAEQNYADSDGKQRIKLRNLGFERTLTLVDGLRLGLQNGLDVSIIPTALVQRIDILSGGASSVYGSDAVAGVVNFVLKKNFDGIDLSGNYSFYNHKNKANAVTAAAGRASFPTPIGWANDGGRVDATLTAGKNLFDNRVNITGFVNYRQADIIPLANRSYSACEATQPATGGNLNCSLASFTAAGTIIPQSGPNAGTVFVNDPLGSGTFRRINTGPGTSANPYDGFSAQRNFERVNAGGFLTAKVTDDVELYSSLLWYQDKSRSPRLNRTLNFGFYGMGPYSVNCNNPFLSSSQSQALCGANAGTAALASIDVRYRFDGLPPLDDEFKNSGVRATAGLRGRGFDDAWSYDVVGVYSRNTSTATSQSIPDFVRVNRALKVVNINGVPTCQSVVDGTDSACVPFNAFAPGNSSTALSNYILSSPFGSSTSNPRMVQIVASVSGDLGKYGIASPFAEQGLALALGAEYRDEKFTSTADAAFRASSGGTDQSFQQNVLEANVELQAPLVERQRWTDLLQVNAGYRISKYNRLEGRFSTWKVEGLWAPIEDITFRASFNKAQRAPTVIEAVQASNISYVTAGSRNDPCSAAGLAAATAPATLAQCRATGLPDNLYGSATLNCPDGLCTIRNGGFGLTPETARTKTFGVVLRPRFLPGLTVSVDRYFINLNDSIGYIGAGDFLNGCLVTGEAYYCRGVVRNPGSFTLISSPGAATGFFAQGTTNTFKSTAHGLDVQAQYVHKFDGFGGLDISFNGSRATRFGGQDAPEIARRNCVGYYGPFCGEGFPRWTHQLRTTWTHPNEAISLSANWRHIGPMALTYNATDPDTGLPFLTTADDRAEYNRIDSYDYLDLSALFVIDKRFELRLAVNNVFDKNPPIIPNSRELLGLLRSNTVFRYDLLGRQIVAGATVRF